MAIVKCVYPTGKTSAAGIEIDAFISESYHFGNKITDAPSEDGGGAGTVTEDADTLQVEAFIGSVKFEEAIGASDVEAAKQAAATPVEWPSERVKGAFAQLKALKESRKPMDIVTGLTVMTDMVITSLDITRNSETGADLAFSMSFTKAPKPPQTGTAGATPAGEAGAASVNTGKGGMTRADEKKNSLLIQVTQANYDSGGISREEYEAEMKKYGGTPK